MKTITLFKLQSESQLLENIAEILEQNEFREVGEFDKHSIGTTTNIYENTFFAENVGAGNGHSYNIITIKEQTKVVEKYALKKLTFQKEMELEGNGHSVNKELRKVLMEQAEQELLPKTSPKAPKAYTVAIRNDGLVLVEAKLKKAEEITSYLRDIFGTFPTIPVDTTKSPQQFMDTMALDDQGVFTLADRAKLDDPAGLTHTLSSGSLYDSEISKYVSKQNMSVTELQMDCDGISRFTLKADMSIDGIKMEKGFMETAEDKATTFLLTLQGDVIVSELLSELG